MLPGDRVQIALDNGYKDTGTLLRRFKNGRWGVREDRKGRYYVRSPHQIKLLSNEDKDYRPEGK